MKVYFIINEYRARGDQNYAIEIQSPVYLDEANAMAALEKLADSLQGEWNGGTFQTVPADDLDYDSLYIDQREIADNFSQVAA